jgi:hypothetical protein
MGAGGKQAMVVPSPCPVVSSAQEPLTTALVERNGQCGHAQNSRSGIMMAGNGYAPHVRLRGNNRLVYKVSTELHEACSAEADRRHVTVSALMRRMLEKIVQDKLFDAIIDDGK